MIQGRDYIGVGVGAVIRNNSGQLFLAKRGPLSRNEIGKWEFPGGSVQFSETLRDALIREIGEEFGILVAVHELLHVADHIIPQEHQHWVSPSFLCSVTSGTPSIREPGKIEQIGWFDLEHIPEDHLTIASRQCLDVLRNKLFFF